jgi:hypothetical protein
MRVDQISVLPTLGYSYVHETFVYVGADVAPAEVDWTAYLRFIEQRKIPGLNRCLVYSASAPNAGQRRALHETTSGMDLKIAVLSDSAIARGAVTTLSWMSPGYRAFHPDKVAHALVFLELQEQAARGVEIELRLLRRMVEKRVEARP